MTDEREAPGQNADEREAPGQNAEEERPSKHDPPVQVRTAWTLWMYAAVLALAGGVASALTSRLADLPAESVDQLREAAERASIEGGPEYTVDGIFTGVRIALVVLAFLLAAICVWAAFRMRAGKLWARALLDLAAILLAVTAGLSVFGVFAGTITSSAGDTAWSFVPVACQILAGLCAGVALWQQRSADATPYFAGSSRAERR